MLTAIKPFHQGKTKYCAQFAVTHSLMTTFSAKLKTEVLISPWRVVINTWRWKYLNIWGEDRFTVHNRASSTRETFEALAYYGIQIRHGRNRDTYHPILNRQIDVDWVKEYLDKGFPVIATVKGGHEIVVVGIQGKHYRIIDSLKVGGYRLIKKDLLINYQIIQ